ncbi:acetylornithine transaminase [Bradymonadaceae bacterium TMQ3]|uniref:Acetylornithine aminotransferase n=1 Tax=Lujinxingia sediminis TaxID=2480984 RepID=A0ABY0CWJ1_9DELT|nr:acetylornithine transaminase [Lujinxingia sediminis]RDV39719.1 acetylornithine transaminase [Bradymonadaceae bacterium TMQ3]RVU48236.1 acetylornithine transaminase [Lujinxingia sediminis]TXC77537.1 acetylornithine transaminase [Bradymonadales bacterium TMQ1]
MTDTAELLHKANDLNSPNYAPAPIIFERGQGVRLFDSEGKEYLDFVAGIAVCALGHAHPTLSDALRDQVGRLLHVSNLYYTAEQIALMEALVEKSFADRVFFCNSGAEANEAAIKLARRYQKVVAGRADKTGIVTMTHSFHGRTLAAITATGQPKYHEGFEPLVPGFSYVPFNDLDALRQAVDRNTAAVMVEPVQGEGGVRPADAAYLKGVREICDKHGALLIFDEVQTGVGRTGSLFAYQHYGVTPDIMSLAKGLGGGVPLGATLASAKAWAGWTRGSHASTFGGNPLATRAGHTVLEVIARDNLLENARARGERLQAGLRRLAEHFDVITDVRGLGLMVGAECKGNAASAIASAAQDEGLLINTAGGNTLRFVPPLIITDADVDEALERLERAIEKVVS